MEPQKGHFIVGPEPSSRKWKQKQANACGCGGHGSFRFTGLPLTTMLYTVLWDQGTWGEALFLPLRLRGKPLHLQRLPSNRLQHACRILSIPALRSSTMPRQVPGQCGFDPWVGKILWRRACQYTPVFLPGEFQGQRRLVGYSHKESDMTEAT